MTVHEALTTGVEEIRAKIEELQGLLQFLEYGTEKTVPYCNVVACGHDRLLKTILLEVVEALESSRKAFKSKELEMLRKKLIRILADVV